MFRVAKVLCVVALALAFAAPAQSQTARDVLSVYREGPVWHMIYMRTGPGQREAYLDQLSRTWTKQIQLAEKMGFVLRHHVLTKWPASTEDWDVLIIEVFPNMAAYDTFWKNWAAVDAQVVQDRNRHRATQATVAATRTMLGVQIAREIFLVPPEAESR